MLLAAPHDRPDITQACALLDWPFISISLGNFQSSVSQEYICGGTLQLFTDECYFIIIFVFLGSKLVVLLGS